MPGLLDRSRASHRHPNATAEDLVTLEQGFPRTADDYFGGTLFYARADGGPWSIRLEPLGR